MKLISSIIHFFSFAKLIFSKKVKNQISKNNHSVFKDELDQKEIGKWQEKCYLSEHSEFETNKIPTLLKKLLLKPASSNSKQKFNLLITENVYFSDFDHLNQTILKSTANKIDFSKQLIHVVKKEKFKTNLVFFYNVLVKLIGAKITPYLLYELNVENEDKMEQGILAVAKGEVRNSNFYSFDITFNKKALNMKETEIYGAYVSKFYSTYNVFYPFIHEMGHIIDYYARTPLTNRENLLTIFNNKKHHTFLETQSKNMIINNDYNLIQNVTNENRLKNNYNEPVAAKELKNLFVLNLEVKILIFLMMKNQFLH